MVSRPNRLTRCIAIAIGTLGDGVGAGAGGDDDGDAAGGGGVEVDPLDADPGAGHHPQPRCASQKLLVHHGIRAGDRALRLRQVGLGGFRDEPAAPVEDRVHQVRVDDAEADDERQVGDLRHCRPPAAAA